MNEISFKSFLEGFVASSVNLPVDQRLKIGWGAEDFVISVLERFLGPVRKSNAAEDRGSSKLDAYITASKIGKGTVVAQIKARESGKDILVEWYKSYPHLEGRDKIGKADLYVTMDPTRTSIYLISAAEIKRDCEKMFNEWRAAGEPPSFRNISGELRLQQSRDYYGEYKVMIYLKPAMLQNKGLPGWPSKLNVPADMRT